MAAGRPAVADPVNMPVADVTAVNVSVADVKTAIAPSTTSASSAASAMPATSGSSSGSSSLSPLSSASSTSSSAGSALPPADDPVWSVVEARGAGWDGFPMHGPASQRDPVHGASVCDDGVAGRWHVDGDGSAAGSPAAAGQATRSADAATGAAAWPAASRFVLRDLTADPALVALLTLDDAALQQRCIHVGLACLRPALARTLDARQLGVLARACGEARLARLHALDATLVEALMPLPAHTAWADVAGAQPLRFCRRIGATRLLAACAAVGPAFAESLRRRLAANGLTDAVASDAGQTGKAPSPSAPVPSDAEAAVRLVRAAARVDRALAGPAPRLPEAA